MNRKHNVFMVVVLLANLLIQPIASISTVFAQEEEASLETQVQEVIVSEPVVEEVAPEVIEEVPVEEPSIEVPPSEETETPTEVETDVPAEGESSESSEEESESEESEEEEEKEAVTTITYVDNGNQTSNLRTGSTSRFSFNVRNTESAVENAVVRVTVPLTHLETYGSLAEYFPGQGIGSLLSSRVEGNNLIVDYNVQTLSEKYNQNFTFEFKSIDDGSMSNGAQIPVKAAVIKSGSAVAQTSNVTYHYVTRQPHFSTNVTYPAEASEDDDEDAQQQTEVLFSFSFGDEGAGNGSGRSGVSSIAVTANVPETLTFDSSLNEGWSYDEGSRTASYSFTPDASIYDAAYSMPNSLSLLATSNDKDIQESIYAEATFSFANGDVVTKSNQAEVAMMAAFDMSPMSVIVDNLVSNFKFTINPGQSDERTVSSGEVLLADLANMATIKLDYGITKPNNVDVAVGDQYIINLPEIFTGFEASNQEIRVNGGLVATFDIVSGQIIITFTDLANDYDDTEMDVFVTGDFNTGLFDEKEETVVNVPLQGEADFTLTIRPEQEDYAGQDKKEAGEAYILDNGEKVFTNRNPEFVDWKVIANDSMASISGARVIDSLGENLTLVPDSIKVERIIRNFKNEEVDRENVVVIPTMTDSGFVLILGEIEDAYEITYTTAITRPEGGGERTLNNSARIELDGDSEDYSANVPVTWSGDIPTLTKAGVISSDRKDVIDWTVEYNYGKELLGSVTLTDSLSHGEINLDSVVVLQVETDIDGNKVGEGTPVSVTPVLTDNGVTLPGLDADGKAYLITFSSTVPVGLNDTVINTISDDLTNPNTAEASVPVNTMPTGNKLGEQSVDSEGRPYIDWTVTMNSERIDVPSIDVRDVFDPQYLEFSTTEPTLFSLTKDGEPASNFTIADYNHDDEIRKGFYLNVTDAGPHEYKFVYRTYYTVEGMQETELANNAELIFLDGEGIGIGEIIRVNPTQTGPKAKIEKTGKYVLAANGVDQEIEWTVVFNNSKILLNKGTTLTDNFTSGNYSYVANSLVMSPNVAHTFTVNGDGSGFVIELTESTKETITVTFRTSTDDANSTNPEHKNDVALKWQGGEEKTSATVGIRHLGINKSGELILNNEDGTKTINWTVNFNTNANVIHNFKLVDTYTPTTVTVSDIVITSGGSDVTSAFSISSERTGGSFTVAKDRLDAVAYQLTYSTTLSAEEEATDMINTAAIEYTGGDDSAKATIKRPTIGVKKEAVDLVKTDAGDFINWKITANTDKANQYVNLVNAVLTDTIPADQILVRDTIVVTREDNLDSTALSTITQEDNSFSIGLPNGPYQYTVTFQTEILEYPSVGNAFGQYENDTVLTNQPGVVGLESSHNANASINYFGDGTNNDSTKEGILNDDTENVDWTVVLNPLGLTINNTRVEDTLTGDHDYVADSIKVWDATNPEAPVELGAGSYSVTPGDKTFTINFLPGTITTPIMVTYSTRINEEVIGRRDLANSIKFFGGDRKEAIDEESTSFAATQWFYGGGGSGRTLEFTLNKLNTNNESVGNSTFEFIRVTASGTKVPLNNMVTTDSTGKFNLTDVRAGTYIVNEISAPNAYDVLTEPIYMTVGYTPQAQQTEGAGEYQVIVTDANWVPITSGPASAEGNTLTVINQFKTTEVSATKNWLPAKLDGEDHPETWLKIYRKTFGQVEEAVEGAELKAITGKSATETVTWTGVQTFSIEGERYEYSVKEVNADGEPFTPAGYSKLENGLTVTNTNIETIPISGTKTWNDYENAHDTRPSSIFVKLLQDGEEHSIKTVTPNQAGEWNYSFGNLPKYNSDGNIHTYVIDEVVIDGYVKTTDDFNLINTYENTERIEVSGEKVWDDWNDLLTKRPTSVTVNLLQNEAAYLDSDSEEVTAIANAASDWKFTFSDLPKYDAEGVLYRYAVTEEQAEGYEEPVINGFTITNKVINDEKTEVTVTKSWDDWNNHDNGENQLTVRPDLITVQLFKDEVAEGEVQAITATDNWTYTFTELDKYDDNGKVFEYSVEEVDVVDNYETTVNGLAILNTYLNTEKVDITGVKTWDDYSNQFGTRPDNIVVTLNLDGKQIDSKIINKNDTDNWEFSFNDLDKYDADGNTNDYTVDELVPLHYTKSIVEEDEDNTFTITNTYVNNEQISINGQKVWNDFDDKLSMRPESIDVSLYQRIGEDPASDTLINTATISSEENWLYDFGKQPKYDALGNEYVYTIVEDFDATDYNSVITGTSVITNTYINDDTVAVAGQKIWNDWSDEDGEFADNQATVRPDSVTVNLFRNSVKVDTVEVTADDDWQYSFTDLAKFDDALNEYVYTIEEKAVSGYETTYDGYNITNTYLNDDTLDLSGFKIWDDYNNKFGIRLEAIEINLLQDGTAIREADVKANGAGIWSYEFTDLPVYDTDGREFVYSLQEDTVPGYNAPVVTETEAGFDITNKFVNTELTQATVTKEWNDWVGTSNAENQLTPRPASITVQLLQNEEAYGELQEITDANWSYTFIDLPKYDELGELYEYTVEEVAVENYSTTTEGLTITNTYQNTELVDISGNKVWVDYSNQHNTRPVEIAIYLLQDGQPYGLSQVVTDDGNEDDEWAFVFEGLPKYDANGRDFSYTFNEVATAPYVKSIDEAGRVITNTYVNTEVIDLVGQKVWADYSDEYGLRPEAITVNLFRNGTDQEVSQVVKENPAGQWIYNFEDLAKYDENGIAYTYTVTEDAVEGYTTNVDEQGFVINTIDPQNTGLAGEKTWVDYDNKFETRPESITVNLLQNGKEFDKQEVTPNQDGQWLYQFTDIPDRDEDGKQYVYSVEEEALEEYAITYDGYDITNTYVNTETVDINGEKVWDDYNDKFETRPDSILVVLYRNGTDDSFRRVVADADDNWKFSFADLPVYDAEGNAYEYSVEEVTVRPYTSEKTLNDEEFVTFTNTYINNETTEFNGQKHWEDFDDQYGLRPESINVILNQNGTEFESQTVEADQRGNWRYNFSDLPKYDELGNAYKYAVEDNTYAYEMDTYYNDLYNALITTDVVGTKTWNDFEDKFGLRPDAITINLNQSIEGSEESSVLHSTEVSAGNNWSYAFNNIPAFDANGNEYIYSVSEEAVEDKPLGAYDFNAEGYDLINTLVTTQVEVTKTWNDFEDSYGLRPETINFNLLQNGEVFDSVTVSANESWSHNFMNIPQFNATGEAYVYTVTEDKVEAYDTVVTDYVVNNTLITQDISGKKTWNDFEDKFGLRPDAITVNLVQSITDSEEISVLKTVVVTAEDEWAFGFADVPVYDAAGNEYIYTLTEEVNAAYSPVIDNNEYSITNNLKLTEFTGTKVWKDSDNQFGLRPDAITVRLFQAIPGSVEQVEITNQTVTAENDWTFTFSELPLVNAAGVEYIYSITEDEINAYATDINGSEITNSLITIPVAGQKVWNDYTNKFGVRPETITINLLQNGETLAVLPVTAAEDGSWSFSFGEVPEFDAEGDAYIYTVTEDAVPEYNAPEINGTIITNTYVNSDVIAISGEKLWDDFENRLESRPESITVVLLQNDVAYLEPQIITPDQNNKWIYSFTDLPEYDELGEAYTYTIEELAVERYETTYGENGEITNSLIPDISVSVGDYVWYDANKDGLQDETDVPLAGVVLTIENADGSPVTDIEGLPVGPQVTDENGYYSFDKLPADTTYVVRIDQAASAEVLEDYTPTIDETGGDNSIDSSTWTATSRHLVEDEERDPTLDFGFVLKKVSVGDYVWIDENKDGLQDETDVPLAGVVLTITTKDGKPVTDVNGKPVGPTTTDENGWYTFDDLPANETYVVTIDQAASKEALKGLQPTIEVPGDNSVDSSTWTATSRNLTEDEERDPTLDFGFVRKKVSVGDYVWIDVNKDGLQDGTDIPLAGVVLTIKTKDGKEVTDVNGNPVGPQTTDGNGYYSFDNLPADETYVVTIDQEASKEALKDLLPTIETDGSIAIDSSTWTATSRELTEDEERDPTLDFGFVRKKVSVGDYVWFDKNKDGVQGEDEPGIPNVILEIRDEDGNPVTDVYGKPVGPQTTDKNGKYSFDDLPTDKVYVVTIAQEQPALDGYKTTKENQGDPATDSSTWTATSRHMTEDGDRDPTLDFGFYIPSGSVGDYVWFDKNNDGLQDKTDVPLKGVVLTIEDEAGNPVTDVFGNPVQPQTTDENGYYIFENLPLGHSYTVRIDQTASAEVLKGYETALEAQGEDISIDSSTWFATSVVLTEDGQHDPTLDFGFVLKEGPGSPGTSGGSSGNLPSTGDSSWLWYGLMTLGLGLAVMFTGKKRKEEN